MFIPNPSVIIMLDMFLHNFKIAESFLYKEFKAIIQFSLLLCIQYHQVQNKCILMCPKSSKAVIQYKELLTEYKSGKKNPHETA